MDELDHRGQQDGALGAVAAEPASQQEERGPDALAPALLDVAGDLAHEPHVGAHLLGEERFDLEKVVLHESHDLAKPGDPSPPLGLHAYL